MSTLSKKIIVQHKPIFDKKDALAVQKIIKSGWISEGKETKKLEENFRKFVGTKYAIATTSGTSAIFLALAACNLKKGDEVIIPNLTFAATGNAVWLTGARPVIAEIDPNSFTISIDSILKNITKKTKAIIPVHLNGRSTNMNELAEICEKHDLKIIEDVAQALGSKYQKKYLGSIGEAGTFSLTPPKIITMGQGGIITTDNHEIFNNVRDLKDQGRHDKSDNHPTVGYNFKITDYQAALGNSQFLKLKSRLKKTREIHNWYRELLKNTDVEIPQTSLETHLWYFDILNNRRKQLIQYLKKSSIQTRTFYKPLNTHPPFKTTKKFPVTEKISNSGLYLPSSIDLTKNDVELISSKINQFFNS